jgi:hypothetical protein
MVVLDRYYYCIDFVNEISQLKMTIFSPLMRTMENLWSYFFREEKRILICFYRLVLVLMDFVPV